MFLAVSLAGVSSCSKKGTDGDDADDGNNPYTILDLSVSSTTDSSVTLIWTATGDDADLGTASVYDLRCWHAWIGGNNWDSAVQVQGEPHPSAAGQRDSMCVTGLQKDSAYYFALQVCDEANNCAGSNGVMGISFEDVIVHFPDTRLDSAVRAFLSLPAGDIWRSDLLVSQAFYANQAGIASMTGIEAWTSLVSMSVAGNSVTDLAPISALPRLLALGLTDNGIVDISALATMVRLELLQLRSNAIVDITPLAGVTGLHMLDLTDNQIAELAPLAANPGLTTGDTVYVGLNPLSPQSLTVDVPELEARGVTVLGI
jgi:hypothetical protein